MLTQNHSFSSAFHFVHSTSVDELGLGGKDDEKKPLALVAFVLSKEYCQAKKTVNRGAIHQLLSIILNSDS
jgi:hypothetical protein